MTETLDPMDQTKIDHQKLAQQLLAQAKADGVELVGPNGLRVRSPNAYANACLPSVPMRSAAHRPVTA
ncbi:hypothetical protein [Rhodococcus tibetensis]|uniref:Transposase n=1 Tax=Rhodococcus tibetensis TaxID=2965064 RepID=A0ABT1QKH2_9NOCA|nr:hypothetical protein [Rhodococcus sp. FXJ9.536]MCQ4122707.1 hypothetical protein [Rhodococcus sp. FXJ9.536]